VTTTTTILAAAGDTTFAFDGDVAVRLLAATVLGGLVGIEREASDQAAGLRTHIAVALGAALFGAISTLGFLEFDRPRSESVIQADVTRVASNVVIGIGFLGAGLIFRQGSNVRNLTTAASLWAVAAVGLACGVGNVTSAAIGAAVLLASLVVLRPLRALIRRRWRHESSVLRVCLAQGADPGPVVGLLNRPAPDGPAALHMSVTREEGGLVILAETAAPPEARGRWLAALAGQPDVTSIQDDTKEQQ
jgi:putative Mg2+ transporter-C (MgtC) family protein